MCFKNLWVHYYQRCCFGCMAFLMMSSIHYYYCFSEIISLRLNWSYSGSIGEKILVTIPSNQQNPIIASLYSSQRIGRTFHRFFLSSSFITLPNIPINVIRNSSAFCRTIIRSDQNQKISKMKSFGTFNGVKMSMDNQIYGNREFYQFIEKTVQVDISTDGDRLSSSSGATKASMSKRKSKSALFRGNSRELIEMVDRNIIGRDTGFQGPFGPRRSK